MSERRTKSRQSEEKSTMRDTKRKKSFVSGVRPSQLGIPRLYLVLSLWK